jgi:hypothetical protein
MSPIEKLLAGHKTLYTLMAAEARICDRATMPQPAETLMQARWAIARALMEQITFEEAYVLAPLEASTDRAELIHAKSIRDTQTAFVERMFAHAHRWHAEAVACDWPGFLVAMADVHRLVGEQLVWERLVVLPAMARLEGASAAPKHNWARQVWDVKDAFTGAAKRQ